MFEEKASLRSFKQILKSEMDRKIYLKTCSQRHLSLNKIANGLFTASAFSDADVLIKQ